MQQGAVELSRLNGAAIIPVTNSARPRRLFDSWDRFQVPHPFARIVVSYGEPLLVPHDAGKDERERCRLAIEERLRRLTSGLDESLGYRGPDIWPHEGR